MKWVLDGRRTMRMVKQKSWCLAILTDDHHHNTNTCMRMICTYTYLYTNLNYFLLLTKCQNVSNTKGIWQSLMVFVWSGIFQGRSWRDIMLPKFWFYIHLSEGAVPFISRYIRMNINLEIFGNISGINSCMETKYIQSDCDFTKHSRM